MIRKSIIETAKVLVAALIGLALIVTAPVGRLGFRAVVIMILLCLSMLLRILYLRGKRP